MARKKKEISSIEDFEEELESALVSISPSIRIALDRMLGADVMRSPDELRGLMVLLFKGMLFGEIPITLSPELRAWCRDLLPVIIAAQPKGPVVNVNGGNVLLQIIHAAEMEQVPVNQIIEQSDHPAKLTDEFSHSLTVPAEAVLRDQLVHDLEVLELE